MLCKVLGWRRKSIVSEKFFFSNEKGGGGRGWRMLEDW